MVDFDTDTRPARADNDTPRFPKLTLNGPTFFERRYENPTAKNATTDPQWVHTDAHHVMTKQVA